MPTRILIADDHSLFRAGLASLLAAEPDLEIVGEAGTGEEALQKAAEYHPDLVLMDIKMPGMDGIEATRRFVELLPGIRVLILTMYEELGLMREAINAGASGFLLKRAVKTELIQAIQAVISGDLYVHPAMMRTLLTAPQPASTSTKPLMEPLTPREIEVLRLIANGYTNNQVANLLHVSVRTIEFHRANITGKLNLHSRVDLVRYATENGIT